MSGHRDRPMRVFELQALFKAGQTVAVLADPTVERPPWIERAAAGRIHRLTVPGYEAMSHRSPVLVELAGPEDPLLAASLDTATVQAYDLDEPLRQVGGWLTTPLTTARLAQALGRWMSLREGDGRARFIRFTDPRVLWLMCALDDTGALGAPGHAITQWRLLDWNGAWWDLPVQHLGAGKVNAMARGHSFKGHLAQMETLNQALRAIRRQGGVIDECMARDLASRLSRIEALQPRMSRPARLRALLTEWSRGDAPTATDFHPQAARMPA